VLQSFDQLVAVDVAVAQDLAQQTGANLFSSMDGNDSYPSISMAKQVVTFLDANDQKALAFERRYQFPAGNCREACHAAIDTR